MELKTLYARKTKLRSKGRVLTTTVVLNEEGQSVAVYSNNQPQPHKNKKTIVHSCFTYKLVWL